MEGKSGEAKHPAVGEGPLGLSDVLVYYQCLAIDTFRGVFSLLPDKLVSTIAALEEMRAATCTTQRLAARV